MLLRLLPMWQMVKGRSASAKPRSEHQTSTIRTQFFDMELRHDDGSMDGDVLVGSFSGQRLSSLKLGQLLDLYQECSEDSDSAQVLEAYIDKVHPDWRDHEHARHHDRSAQTDEEPDMTMTLALEILGLDESTDKDQVIKAHRSLMQKLHPDRGGSDYLAQKINAARDFLIKQL